MIEKFWIYENWKTNRHRARIHKSTCKHCLIEGDEPKQSMQGSAWKGPYATIEEANDFAKQLGAKISCCSQCIKDQKMI